MTLAIRNKSLTPAQTEVQTSAASAPKGRYKVVNEASCLHKLITKVKSAVLNFIAYCFSFFKDSKQQNLALSVKPTVSVKAVEPFEESPITFIRVTKANDLSNLTGAFLNKYVLLDPANTSSCREHFYGGGASGAIHNRLNILGSSAPEKLRKAFPSSITEELHT